jgi:RNA polymerase sigma-70 factor (ECF subfamily)
MEQEPFPPTPPAERFIHMIDPLKGLLMAFCRRAIPAPGDRDDVLQTAMASAYSSYHLFQEGTNFRAWILKHLQNAIWNHQRKASGRPGSIDDHAADLCAHEDFGVLSRELTYHSLLQSPHTLFDHFDERIAKALLALSLNERTAFLLRSIGDLAYREISDLMHIPVGTVMSHLSRAREKLRERIVSSVETTRYAPNVACHEAGRGGVR